MEYSPESPTGMRTTDAGAMRTNLAQRIQGRPGTGSRHPGATMDDKDGRESGGILRPNANSMKTHSVGHQECRISCRLNRRRFPGYFSGNISGGTSSQCQGEEYRKTSEFSIHFKPPSFSMKQGSTLPLEESQEKLFTERKACRELPLRVYPCEWYPGNQFTNYNGFREWSCPDSLLQVPLVPAGLAFEACLHDFGQLHYI